MVLGPKREDKRRMEKITQRRTSSFASATNSIRIIN